MIVAYALEEPVGLPGWPRKVRGCLDAGDFLVTFLAIGPKHITCKIAVDLKAGTVGSA